MADHTNMYRFSVKQWSPWAGCEHDCTYCKPTFQRQLKRWGKKNCEACYHFTPHEHEERLEDPRLPKTGFMQFIFTCSSGDIAFCPVDYFEKILATIRRYPDRTFLLQTKDPRILHKVKLPANVIVGVTLETNRDELSQSVSKAPPVSERYEVFKSLKHRQKMVTIEPVMEFDLETMVAWIEDIRPCMVWLGYDSWNTGLPEPELAKVKELYWELGRRGIVVVLKTIVTGRPKPAT